MDGFMEMLVQDTRRKGVGDVSEKVLFKFIPKIPETTATIVRANVPAAMSNSS